MRYLSRLVSTEKGVLSFRRGRSASIRGGLMLPSVSGPARAKSVDNSYRGKVAIVQTLDRICIPLKPDRGVQVFHEGREELFFKSAGSLVPGDKIVKRFPATLEFSGIDRVSEDQALFLGLMIADGTYTGKAAGYNTNTGRIAVGCHDFSSLDIVEALMRRVFSGERMSFKWSDNYDKKGRVYAKQMWIPAHVMDKYAPKLGLKKAAALEKSIPSTILTSSPSIQRTFLTALFAGDGCYKHDQAKVYYSTSSRQLMLDVVSLLTHLGYRPTVNVGMNKPLRGKETFSDGLTEHELFKISITSVFANAFVDEVGCFYPRKSQAYHHHSGPLYGGIPYRLRGWGKVGSFEKGPKGRRQRRRLWEENSIILSPVKSVEIVDSSPEVVPFPAFGVLHGSPILSNGFALTPS